MLGSFFAMLTTAAAGLLVPAGVGLLTVGQHAHVAEVEHSVRRARLVLSGALAVLGSVLLTAGLGAEPEVTWLVAAALAVAVLAGWRRAGSWTTRGVVVRSLLASSAFGLLGWSADRVLTATTSATGLALGAGAWLVLLAALLRLRGLVLGLVADRAARPPRPRSTQVRDGSCASVLRATTAAAIAGVVCLAGPVQSPGDAAPGHSPDRAGGAGAAARSTRPSPTPSHRRRASTDPARAGGAAAPSPTAATASPTAASSAQPVVQPQGSPPPPRVRPTRPTKTPGYAKVKTHRPSQGHSPGSGPPGRP